MFFYSIDAIMFHYLALLQQRAHGLVCEVLLTLIHGLHDFVFLDSNSKDTLHTKDCPGQEKVYVPEGGASRS